MTLSDLGSLGEFIAALATIATLAYLALQIRQSNRAQEMAALADLNDSNARWIGQLIESSLAAETYLLAMEDPAAMTVEQRFRFSMIVLQAMRSGEATWAQTERGIVDADHWSGMRATIKYLFGSEAGRRAFASNRGFVNPGFAEEVDRILAEDA